MHLTINTCCQKCIVLVNNNTLLLYALSPKWPWLSWYSTYLSLITGSSLSPSAHWNGVVVLILYWNRSLTRRSGAGVDLQLLISANFDAVILLVLYLNHSGLDDCPLVLSSTSIASEMLILIWLRKCWHSSLDIGFVKSNSSDMTWPL